MVTGMYLAVATDSHGQEDLIMGLYARYQEPLFLDMDQSDRLPSRSRRACSVLFSFHLLWCALIYVRFYDLTAELLS